MTKPLRVLISLGSFIHALAITAECLPALLPLLLTPKSIQNFQTKSSYKAYMVRDFADMYDLIFFQSVIQMSGFRSLGDEEEVEFEFKGNISFIID